ncbi:MAG: tripartite tricarboxylate transporter TctB family protein [Candidatus Rokubacteria bacterium]|nr:tripartite tricarboxylate transporter TctB family protein [Candidatus Rokubacteria bacterium]
MTVGRDGIAGLVCLAGSLLLLGTSRGLPQPALVPIGPAFYPRILLAVTAVLSATLVGTDLLRRGRRPAPSAVNYRLVLLTFAIFTAYVFLLPVLGYRVTTALFVGVVQATLEPPRGARAWAVVVASAAATMLVSYYVFERYLNVLLPRGWLTGF